MKIRNRLTANHLEIGIHPKLLSAYIEVVLLGIGIYTKVNLKEIKKYYFSGSRNAISVGLLGVSLALISYES